MLLACGAAIIIAVVRVYTRTRQPEKLADRPQLNYRRQACNWDLFSTERQTLSENATIR